ncbi:MAG: hypothetical protein M3Z05_01145 [Gemmatimonadota bacterium]|nr:hypothetical protein [Gemmatimonadota bacterium]
MTSVAVLPPMPVALLRSEMLAHRRKKLVAAILRDVHDMQGMIAVDEANRRPGEVTAKRPDVDAKRQAAEVALARVGGVGQRPGVALVGKCLLLRILIATPAMLVGRRHG